MGAGENRDGAAGFKQVRLAHAQPTDAQVRGDGLRLKKIEPGMDARSVEHVECPGKLVLMDVGGALQPKQDLDVETRIVVHHQLRLPEPGLRLEGLLVLDQKIPEQLVDVHVVARAAGFQRGSGDFREQIQCEVALLPLGQHAASEFHEEGIHCVGFRGSYGNPQARIWRGLCGGTSRENLRVRWIAARAATNGRCGTVDVAGRLD